MGLASSFKDLHYSELDVPKIGQSVRDGIGRLVQRSDSDLKLFAHDLSVNAEKKVVSKVWT